MDSKVDFVAVDNPHANRLILHMLAAFAEHVREQSSQRTKATLTAAKYRGVILGKHGKEVLSRENQQTADAFARQLTPVMHVLHAKGCTTVRALRDVLNAPRVPTFYPGRQWHIQIRHYRG
jgi:DNA invertase Pin-like site-specific DNA recombinase